MALELRQSFTHRSGAVRAGWRSELVFRLMVGAGGLAAGALASAMKSATIRPAAAAVWVGLVLFWTGMSLRLWSFRTLGHYFTFVVQTSSDQPVVTAGPYRFVRHPSYAALLLMMTGVGLFIGNWWSLVCLTAAFSGALAYRIRVEEKALLHDLGDSYRAYAATHRRLVPFVW